MAKSGVRWRHRPNNSCFFERRGAAKPLRSKGLAEAQCIRATLPAKPRLTNVGAVIVAAAKVSGRLTALEVRVEHLAKQADRAAPTIAPIGHIGKHRHG